MGEEIAVLLDTKIEKIDYSVQKTRRKLKKVLWKISENVSNLKINN